MTAAAIVAIVAIGAVATIVSVVAIVVVGLDAFAVQVVCSISVKLNLVMLLTLKKYEAKC